MSNGISSLSNKEARMHMNASDVIVSDRMYNMIIGAVVVYGVLVNAVIVKFMAPLFTGMNPFALLIGYIVLCLAGTLIAARSDSPLISFLGYNMVVVPIGAVLSVCLQGYDTSVITQAFVMTTIVTAIMLIAATLYPGTFAGMGRMLFTALIGLVVAQLVCMLFGVYPTVIAWVAAAIFALYIGYDWVKAQMYVKTLDNAVDSALDIYLDIINLFLQLLRIFASRSDD